MKTPKSHHYFRIIMIVLAVFIGYEMFKAFSAGVTAIGDLLLAPFTAAKKVFSALTGWIGGLFSGSSNAAPPTTVLGTSQTPSQLLGIDAGSPLGQMLDSQSNVNATNQAIIGTAGQGGNGGVVGIWGTSAGLSIPGS